MISNSIASQNIKSHLLRSQTSAQGQQFSEALPHSQDLDLIKQTTVASLEVFLQPVRQKPGELGKRQAGKESHTTTLR